MLNFDKEHLKKHIPRAADEGYLHLDGKRLIITQKGRTLALELLKMRPSSGFKDKPRSEQLRIMLDHILCQMEVFANGS